MMDELIVGSQKDESCNHDGCCERSAYLAHLNISSHKGLLLSRRR